MLLSLCQMKDLVQMSKLVKPHFLILGPLKDYIQVSKEVSLQEVSNIYCNLECIYDHHYRNFHKLSQRLTQSN